MYLKNKKFKHLTGPENRKLSCSVTNQIKPFFLPSLSYLSLLYLWQDNKMGMRFWKRKTGTGRKTKTRWSDY